MSTEEELFARFTQAMEQAGPFEPRPRLAVALSGGPDSRALLLLAQRWAEARHGAVAGLIVDHGLRPESAAEGAQTAQWLQHLGVPAAVLPLQLALGGNLQARARAARYAALGDWCRQAGIVHLLLGHHADDQMETLLQRLTRGSGLDGLSVMAAVEYRPDLRLLRPLLSVTKEELRDFLKRQNQGWLDDPSNDSDAFSRNRLRRLTPELRAEGLTPARLASTVQRLQESRDYIAAQTARFLACHAGMSPAGFAWVDHAVWQRMPPELARRGLRQLVTAVRGSERSPRYEEIERLHAALQAASFRGATLHGCRLQLQPASGRLYLFREKQAAPFLLEGESGRVRWDERFELGWHQAAPGVCLRYLGAEGRRQLAGEGAWPRGAELPPAAVLETLPSLWRLDRCLWVPHIPYGEPLANRGPTLRFRPAKPLADR